MRLTNTIATTVLAISRDSPTHLRHRCSPSPALRRVFVVVPHHWALAVHCAQSRWKAAIEGRAGAASAQRRHSSRPLCIAVLHTGGALHSAVHLCAVLCARPLPRCTAGSLLSGSALCSALPAVSLLSPCARLSHSSPPPPPPPPCLPPLRSRRISCTNITKQRRKPFRYALQASEQRCKIQRGRAQDTR